MNNNDTIKKTLIVAVSLWLVCSALISFSAVELRDLQEANKTLDYEIHRDALLKLQAKIYEDQPYVFLYCSKRKFALHKRFDNREMFFEFPGVMINNLKLNSNFVSSSTLE